MMNDQTLFSPTATLRRIASNRSLFDAWRSVRANRGAAGVDAITLQAFERSLDANLAELARNLLSKSYEPLPARHVNVDKPDGRLRELAIPTVRDRVVQRAVLDHVEPLFEPQFLDCSYAFRPGRSVEMAIQRIVVARARGYCWTAEADIHDFFPSLDHQLLLAELSQTMDDPDVLHLITQWLDAGALEGCRPSPAWIANLKSALASGRLAVGDAIGNLVDEFVSERLGVAGNLYPDSQADLDDPDSPPPGDFDKVRRDRNDLRKAALRRLAQDGLLLGLAERAAIKALFTSKLLGFGAAGLLAALAGPPLIRKIASLRSRSAGTMQGSPISPLLSNVYLHPFDREMTGQGRRLVRYCDDFIVNAGSKAEAEDALEAARRALGSRRLRLSREKTRIVAPGEPFEFLGYQFTGDGRILPPPSIPAVVARGMIDFANRYRSRASAGISSTTHRTKSALDRFIRRLRKD